MEAEALESLRKSFLRPGSDFLLPLSTHLGKLRNDQIWIGLSMSKVSEQCLTLGACVVAHAIPRAHCGENFFSTCS